ncbi:hypothetical protein [Methylocystis parvus]|uniref:Chromosome partitioning protein ParA n=1 Tax=Methylocystis parvus TaxID=134 RepID=A0A6B8M6J4_9HYPH|nr:hypothetical protein [Methylocystis parvus]QGM96440.1 hypothetical protein F7D14_02370 [Methylocystis parvus]WBJ99712.1 hypothetical protein MMG94_17255 [Methylocystis parvus OBBP]
MNERLHAPVHASADTAAAFARLAQWSGRAPVESHGPAPLPEWTLDQIGAEDEAIKNRCIDLVQKIDELTQVKDCFVEISNWIGHVLSAREQTNAALVERGMMIAMVEGALTEAKEDNRTLYEGREEARAENSLLLSENERLRAIVQLNEGRIEKLEADLREAQDAGAAFHEAYEAERAQAYHLRGEVDDLQAVVAKNDALVAELQRHLAVARDEAVFAAQRGDALQASLTEAQAAWRAESEEARGAVTALEAKLQEQTARALAAEGLLSEARAALQEKSEQIRLGERQAAEMEQKILRISEHSESVAVEADALKQRLEARDGAHARLSKRARALIRVMRDLASRMEKAEQKAALAGERLNAETGRFEDQKSQLEQSIRDLAEQLEKERAAGQVTAGALEAARRQRAQQREEEPCEPREEGAKLIDLLARAEKAHLAAEAAASMQAQAPIRA